MFSARNTACRFQEEKADKRATIAESANHFSTSTHDIRDALQRGSNNDSASNWRVGVTLPCDRSEADDTEATSEKFVWEIDENDHYTEDIEESLQWAYVSTHYPTQEQ